MKFIIFNLLRVSKDITHESPVFKEWMKRIPFNTWKEKEEAIVEALERLMLLHEDEFKEDNWMFESSTIKIAIDVDEISYFYEVPPTIDGCEIPKKFWKFMKRATMIVLKDGTEKMVAESIEDVNSKISNLL